MHALRPIRPLVLLALATAGCQATTSGQVSVTPSPTPGAAMSAAPAASATPSATPARELGEAKAIHGANATLYSIPATGGGYSEIGFELPQAAVEAAPVSADAKATITTLRFSEAVRQATFVDHLDIDYNPQGHEPPGTYDLPHFDFHFFGVDEATKQAIDCKDETLPAAARLPTGYAFLPPPKGQCVPLMGFHASELSSPELQPSPQPFTRTMILGFYGGNLIFIEPMMTKAFLSQKQDFTLAVGRPAELGRQTLYPSSFKATFDAGKNSWSFALREWSQMAK